MIEWAPIAQSVDLTPMVTFLRHVLPSQGWYIAWGQHPTLLNRKGEPKKRQESAATIEQLARLLIQWNFQGFNTYFAIAAFIDRNGPLDPNKYGPGKPGHKPRAHENVRALIALIADIDTKESHAGDHYSDRGEAYLAIIAFCQAIGIPMPVVVSSGGGLHCYWPLEQELPRADWEVLANRLKAAMLHHGFKIDPSRAADASSVLRPVGTKHHKSGRIVEAGELVGPYPLAAFDVLKKFKIKARPQKARARQAGGILGSLWANEPIDPEKIAQKCQQIAFLKDQPGKCSEPVHYAGAGVFAQGGDRGRDYFLAFHDPEYRAQCAEQLQRAANYPTTCEHFWLTANPAGSGRGHPGGCDGCPHKGKITSPIVLGRRRVVLIECQD